MGWIGVDLDGTLARYDGWVGIDHIGDPVPLMLERVKRWLGEGKDVRIMTARVCPQRNDLDRELAATYISLWCREHVGRHLSITHEKDFQMVELWDDRCIQVEPNTGRRVDGVAD